MNPVPKVETGPGNWSDTGRRQTFPIATGQPFVETGTVLGAMPRATSQVLTTQALVDPKMQIHYATFKALIVAIDNQVSIRSMPVLKLIVDNEHRHNRNLDMTYATILRQPDDAFIQMFTSFIRVNYMATRRRLPTPS